METFKKNKKAEITNFIFSTSEKQKQNKKFKRYYQLTTYGPHTNLAQIEKTAQLSTQISKLKKCNLLIMQRCNMLKKQVFIFQKS